LPATRQIWRYAQPDVVERLRVLCNDDDVHVRNSAEASLAFLDRLSNLDDAALDGWLDDFLS
jgi:hypothetical protein